MEFFKKIFIGSFVLLVSAGIYYFLGNDKSMQDDILRTTLETLGNEVLAMAPEGQSKTVLEQKFRDFMNKVGNNELSEKQIQTTAASILNLKMEGKQTTPEVIQAVLEVSIDTIPPDVPREKKHFDDQQLKLNRRELAGKIKQMMNLQQEIERISFENAVAHEIRDNVVFSADSGLQVWISPDIMEQHVFIHNPEFLQRLKKLQEQNIVQYYNFSQVSELGMAGLKFAAPFLSPEDKRKIKLYLNQNPPPHDSLNFEKFFPHSDSINKVINIIRTEEREIKEKEERQSVEN